MKNSECFSINQKFKFKLKNIVEFYWECLNSKTKKKFKILDS